MFRVAWTNRGENEGFRVDWFNTRVEAMRFYLSRHMAVVFDPAGERIA